MCVTGSGHQFNLTTHALPQKEKQSLMAQREAASLSEIFTNQKKQCLKQINWTQRKSAVLHVLVCCRFKLMDNVHHGSMQDLVRFLLWSLCLETDSIKELLSLHFGSQFKAKYAIIYQTAAYSNGNNLLWN